MLPVSWHIWIEFRMFSYKKCITAIHKRVRVCLSIKYNIRFKATCPSFKILFGVCVVIFQMVHTSFILISIIFIFDINNEYGVSLRRIEQMPAPYIQGTSTWRVRTFRLLSARLQYLECILLSTLYILYLFSIYICFACLRHFISFSVTSQTFFLSNIYANAWLSLANDCKMITWNYC